MFAKTYIKEFYFCTLGLFSSNCILPYNTKYLRIFQNIGVVFQNRKLFNRWWSLNTVSLAKLNIVNYVPQKYIWENYILKCRKKFIAYRKDHKYCSKRCWRIDHYEYKVYDHKCESCKNKFKSRRYNTRFCSHKCSSIFNYYKNRKKSKFKNPEISQFENQWNYISFGLMFTLFWINLEEPKLF